MMIHCIVWCPERGQTVADGLRMSMAPHEGLREAACQWAAHSDTRDPQSSVAAGNDAVVRVRDINTGEESEWRVEGELVPAYRARSHKTPNVELSGG